MSDGATEDRHERAPGTLYICATPIGNLEDITLRALRILQSVDFVAAEDTRHTRKLLSHHGISTRLVSYHEHNKAGSGRRIIESILLGQSVALVSDAGMPAVSDPGGDIVRLAVIAGIKVVPLPGPSAVITALSVSGFPLDRFTFLGFLPRDKKGLRAILTRIASAREISIAYEAPHRLKASLAEMLPVIGDRAICIAREITKVHEEFWRGTVRQAQEAFLDREVLGEITLVIDGAGEAADLLSAATEEETRTRALNVLAELVANGVPSKKPPGRWLSNLE